MKKLRETIQRRPLLKASKKKKKLQERLKSTLALSRVILNSEIVPCINDDVIIKFLKIVKEYKNYKYKI